MRIKKSRENEEVSRDRYLITYADLITLLLGLFVILYASSKVDESQYKQVKEALNKAFKSNKPNNASPTCKWWSKKESGLPSS